jgi:hypothetical protein
MCCTESSSPLKLIPFTSARTITRISRRYIELMSMNVIKFVVFLSKDNQVSRECLSVFEPTHHVGDE